MCVSGHWFTPCVYQLAIPGLLSFVSNSHTTAPGSPASTPLPSIGLPQRSVTFLTRNSYQVNAPSGTADSSRTRNPRAVDSTVRSLTSYVATTFPPPDG